MDSDYFDNGPDQETAKPGGGAMDGHDDKEGMDDKPTFLVNKEAYPDAKPGDVLKMRVAAVHDQEMECTVEKDDEHEEHEEEPEPASMPGSSEGGGANDAMMD